MEDEKDTAGWGAFIHALKKDVGPRGKYHDPYNNVLISASSFKQPTDSANGGSEVEVLLFPSFHRLRMGSDETSRHNLIQGRLLRQLGGRDAALAPENELLRTLLNKSPIDQPTILVCGHMTRDKRCGILGPLLQDGFSKYLSGLGMRVNHGFADPSGGTSRLDDRLSVNIGLISHIGGHRWAGNVIIYIPPTWHGPNQNHETYQLAGTGIWYGRVEPKHVQGIVEETLLKGNIIRDLLRGAIKQGQGIMRL